jgi:hypothetical protein
MAYFFYPFGSNMKRIWFVPQRSYILIRGFLQGETPVIEMQIAYTMFGIETKRPLGRRKYM